MQQPPQNPNDAVVQAALTQVLSSPSQMQKLLQALQNQSISSDMFAHHANQNQQQLIGPYDASHLNTNNANTGLDIQPVDHHRLLQSSPSYDPPPSTTSAANAPSPFTLSLLGGGPDADQLIPFEKHDERLQKTYHTAAEISHDVDELQSNINSFLQTLGIDLSSLEVTNQPHSNGAGGASPAGAALEGSNPGSNGVGGTGNNSGDDMGIFTNVSGSEFDFDSFLLDMPRATGEGEDIDRLAEHLDPSAVVGTHNPRSKLAGASTDQLHAFLDEVASQDGSDIGIPAPPPPRTIVVPGSSQHTLSHTIPPPLTQLHNHNSSTPSFGAVPIPASVPAPSTATPGAGPVVGRGKKRKSEVGDGDDATPQPSTLGTPPSTTTNKTKRKR
ncbi:hypothetical protein ID866_7364 [Astraeus odoratus]|nr:hypothetical protein ID866_7364 [Astraeus odoratus]